MSAKQAAPGNLGGEGFLPCLFWLPEAAFTFDSCFCTPPQALLPSSGLTASSSTASSKGHWTHLHKPE